MYIYFIYIRNSASHYTPHKNFLEKTFECHAIYINVPTHTKLIMWQSQMTWVNKICIVVAHLSHVNDFIEYLYTHFQCRSFFFRMSRHANRLYVCLWIMSNSFEIIIIIWRVVDSLSSHIEIQLINLYFFFIFV